MDADPVRLAQVVGNLLTNSAKYTDSNGHIWLSARREWSEVVLRVRDDGIGISPDMLPKVFELFVQVDDAATRAQGGLGIGLTLAKNLVEMHDGTIEARSARSGFHHHLVKPPEPKDLEAVLTGLERIAPRTAAGSRGVRPS